MNRWLLGCFFLLTLLLTLLSPLFQIPLPLQFFYPYLIFILYIKPFRTTLVHAFFCGLVLDLLSSALPLGTFSILLMSSLYILGRIKHLFFIEKLLSLPLLTFFFSSLITLLHWVALNTFCSKTPLSLKWMATDLVILPFCDALYALAFFALPLKLLSKWLFKGKRRSSSLNFKESAT